MNAARILFVMLFAVGVIHAEPGAPPAAEFVLDPEMRMVRIAPDGNTVAWIHNVEGKLRLVTADVKAAQRDSGPQPERATPEAQSPTPVQVGASHVTAMGFRNKRVALNSQISFTIDRSPGTLAWLDSEALLVGLATSTGSLQTLNIVDTATKRAKSIAGFAVPPNDYILDPEMYWRLNQVAVAPLRPREIFVPGRKGRGAALDLWSIDTRNGERTLAARNGAGIERWYIDARGAVVLGSAVRDGRVVLYRPNGPQAAWTEWCDLGAMEDLAIQGIDGASGLLYVSRRGGERWELRAYDVAVRTWAPTVLADPEHDVLPPGMPRLGDIDVFAPLFAPATGRLLGLYHGADHPVARWLDSRFADHQEAIDAMVPEHLNRIVEMDAEERRLLVLSWNDCSPGFWWIFDADTGAATLLARRISGHDRRPSVPVTRRRFALADGTMLQGFVWLPGPAAVPARPPGLVVLLHPRPYEPWMGEFDPLVQFLASRGHAVLQLNHPGTIGRGREFLLAGKRDLGAAVPAALAAAVRELGREGTIDGRRVAVMGTGYGGHLALRAMAAQPGTFACAIAVSPVVDWGEIARSSEGDLRRHWRWGSGVIAPNDEPAALRAFSAVAFAGDIRGPLLLVHGRDDRLAPRRATARFASELKRTGRSVEEEYPYDAGHGIEERGPRVRMFEQIERFLERQFKP